MQTLEQKLQAGAIDLAFFTLSETERVGQNRFRCQLISQEEIVLCTPKKGHYELLSKEEPGRKYPWIDLKYLENDCFLLLKQQTRLGQLAVRLLESQNISPKIVELSSIDTALSLVARQYGIAFASSFRIEEHETAGELSFFSFGTRPEAWDFVAAYGKEHLLTPPEAFLIDLIGSLY